MLHWIWRRPLQFTTRLLRTPHVPPVHSQAPTLPPDKLYEEERSPSATIEQFYPVRLGEVLNSRYEVAAKLGYGAGSTVWSAKDLARWRWQADRYVALKVSAWHHRDVKEDFANAELLALDRVNAVGKQHPGHRYVRRLLDSFKIIAPAGTHNCMVFEPLRENIFKFGTHLKDEMIPASLLPLLVVPILQGLDFLHRECKLVHTDLKPDNIMMAFSAREEQEMLHLLAQHEQAEPLAQKRLNDRHVIYLSYSSMGPVEYGIGRPVITDLDIAVRGDADRSWAHDIQARGFKAPEVLIGAPWSYSVDMWSLGITLLYVVQAEDIFDGADTHTTLARMVACLGPPPRELLQRQVRATEVFESDGTLRRIYPDESLSLESFITRFEGEEKALFIAFIRRVLRWMPEERASAKDLLDDPWINADRVQSLIKAESSNIDNTPGKASEQ